MPSIIFRYIFKNILVFFTGILFVLVFVVFMGQFTKIFTYAMNYGADMLWVMHTMLYLLPDILVLSIPIAVQISILMVLTNMSQMGEIIALRAAGFSFFEIAKPLFIFSLVLTFILVYFTAWLSPQGRHKVEMAKEDIASKISRINIKPKTFLDIGDWDLFAEDVDNKGKTLHQVHLSKKNDNTALSTKINASSGKVSTNSQAITLVLNKGQMQRLDGKDPRKIITAQFDTYRISIPLVQQSQTERRLKSSELTTPQLIEALKDKNLSQANRADYQPEITFRLALALSPLIFFLLSCPFSFVITKKAGRAGAMVASLGFIFGYFGLLYLGSSLGEKMANPFFAFSIPLLPVFIGLIAGIYLWRKKLSN
jgi:lipopolysaccharide export system permease protein